MKTKPLPDLNYLKECFIIDPSVPEGLRWKSERPLSHFKNLISHKIWNGKYGNKKAGSLNVSRGYHHVRIKRQSYLNHRIIYALHYDTIDFHNYLIDHIDNNQSNNDPNNLRLASSSQNQYNSKVHKNNSSGHKNISRINCYKVEFKVNNKYFYTKIFKTLEEAVQARDSVSKQIAGEFYRTT